MYHKWLDRWDERRAQRGEEWKVPTEFTLGSELAFPGENITTLPEFCERAEQAAVDPAFFDRPSDDLEGFEKKDGWIRFPSDITTYVEENNTVWAKITERGSTTHALVVFHHWNARSRNSRLAKFFAKRGITVVEIAMPYHLERSRSGSHYADFMLSANLGRTLQSFRQAVLDGRKLIGFLNSEGYQQISLLGMSLGSWVAGLIAAHDQTVSKASLFLTAGSLADMVWTGRATTSIRESLAAAIPLTDLRRAWTPLNLENHTGCLERQSLKIQVVLAKRDKVVLPEISHTLLHKLTATPASTRVLGLNCGHYSLGRPPHVLLAASGLRRFLLPPCGLTRK
ncbi:RcgR family putative quorum lactone hydrolase [Rhizobium sp.]|uniref:RcgR family putative quorum lactone hydrolase n=1 Tax=Rhizobium sp. TaxID=391 RepID=UPI0028A0503F